MTPTRSRPRPELVLAVLLVLTLALIPIRITTIYSGLPAHPLFLHVPVIFIPLAVLGALACCARPAWFTSYGIALGAVALISVGGTDMTMGAGSALRDALHLGFGGFGPGSLIQQHEHAANILRLFIYAFTIVLLVTVLAHRIASGMPTGQTGLDRTLSGTGALTALRVALVLLAIGSGYYVFRTGDLGAKAVWQGRLQSGGGFPGFGRGGGPGAGGGSGVPNNLFGNSG
jgi:predicted membrane protein DUF2231